MKRLVIVGVLALVACAPSEPPQFEEARTAVRHMMRDPDSATFEDLKLLKSGTVCGRVNAKNGMGGYSGYAPFYHLSGKDLAVADKAYYGQTLVVPSVDDYDLGAQAVEKICG